MIIIGFVCAIIIYPFLHEGGHALATVLLGGKCVAYNLLPLPYMICDATNIGTSELVAIGLSGILFPLFGSFVLQGKNFYVWFTRLILRGMIALSLIISLLVVVLRPFGIVAPNDDITEILHLWGGGTIWIGCGCLVLGVLMIVLIVKDKSIRKIVAQLA